MTSRKQEFIYDNRSVQWPSRTEAKKAISRFKSLIETATSEQQLHAFLENHQYFLAWQEPHCHHVISKPKLGSQLIPDFLLPEMSSAGIFWILVEIERSNVQLMTTTGALAQSVRTAQQQIRDWRRWLEENRDYAIRSIPKGGLGLGELNFRPRGMVIVGRRRDITDRFNQLRSDSSSEGIDIVTYDHILEWAESRASFIGAAARSLRLTITR